MRAYINSQYSLFRNAPLERYYVTCAAERAYRLLRLMRQGELACAGFAGWSGLALYAPASIYRQPIRLSSFVAVALRLPCATTAAGLLNVHVAITLHAASAQQHLCCHHCDSRLPLPAVPRTKSWGQANNSEQILVSILVTTGRWPPPVAKAASTIEQY